ncbi:MAG: response regulator [Haloarculaceae archaeon]
MAIESPSSEPTDTEGEKATVLFVDDEPELLEIYELVCGSDYTVLTATGGEEALGAFDSHVDFAFFDRRMPGMSGDEAIQILRDRGYQTPMAIISAVDPGTELPVDHEAYLTKPISKEEILDTITQHT